MIPKLSFTKQDTNIIKGVGILMIMIHNFFHIIPPAPGENEFLYSPDTLANFHDLLQTYPDKFVRYFFAYFGHYGVQLFIFISAYGLYRSYHQKHMRYFPFLKKRVVKLYPTLAIAVILQLCILYFRDGGAVTGYEIKSSLLKLTLLFNFFPHQALSVNGPWWFFSLIFQFYLIFPFLLWVSKKYGSTTLLVLGFLCLPIEYFFNPFLISHRLNINYTVIGHMEVFCLGIFLADKKQIYFPKWLIGLATVIFILGNFNPVVWLFSFSAITILMLSAFIVFLPPLQRQKRIYTFLNYTGGISLFLFVVQGMLRHPLVDIAGKHNNTWLTLLFCLIYLVLAFLVARLVKAIEKRVQKVIEKTPLATAV